MKQRRDAATEEAYERFRRRILAVWESMEDYIRATVFRWTIGVERGKRVARRPRPLRSGGRPIAFEPNPFPYAVGPTEAHWVLWAERSMSRPLIQKYLDAVLPAGTKFRYFINRRTQQSVPGVWHAHVFLRAGGA